MRFALERFTPRLPQHGATVDTDTSDGKSLLALNIESKYLFLDEDGHVYHEYLLPGSPEIHNLSGYVDKVIKYRDPALFEYLKAHGVSRESFGTSMFPILATRSPQLDLLLFELIGYLRATVELKRVSLFDHGCSVAEHLDLLDVMFRATSDSKDTAASVLSYCGLDKSAMLLTVAKLLHHQLDPQHFQLIRTEGSGFAFRDDEFDLSLSVGVVNHVYDPLLALQKIIRVTRYASVLAAWATDEPEGFWAFNHSGVPFYFFSRDDLLGLHGLKPGGRFLVADFIPESESTQPSSYFGIGQERNAHLGCYHLVYTSIPDVPCPAEVLS
jgi:SAM-dependent methyltransferase